MSENLLVRALKRVGNAIIDVSLKASILAIAGALAAAAAVIWLALRGNPHGPWFYAAAGALCFALAGLVIGCVLVALRMRQLSELGSPQRSSATSEDGWFKAIIEADTHRIEEAILVLGCEVAWFEQSGFAPYGTLRFEIFNGSVFPIALSPNASGFISFNRGRLRGEIIMSTKWQIAYLAPRCTSRFEIRFELTETEAKEIIKRWNAQDFSAWFDLENLAVHVIGAGEFANKLPYQTLKFPFSGVGLDGRRI